MFVKYKQEANRHTLAYTPRATYTGETASIWGKPSSLVGGIFTK